MKTLLTYSLVLASLFAQAQDVIVFRNGTQQNAKVLEVGTTNVVYKKVENTDGPNYVADKNQVYSIEYANGYRDVMPNPYSNPTTNTYPATLQNNSNYSTPGPSTTYVRPHVNVVVAPPAYYGGMGWGGGYNRPWVGGYYGRMYGGYGGHGGYHHSGHHRW